MVLDSAGNDAFGDKDVKASNIPYVIAVVVMALIGVVASVIVVLARPEKDNTTILTLIAASIAPTTAGLLAFMKSQETHLVVNSRMTEFRTQLEVMSRLKQTIEREAGIVEGKQAGVAIANARTDLLKEHEKE